MHAAYLFIFAALISAAPQVAQCGSLLQDAASRAKERSNPLDGQERARLAGAKLYRRECASCHGESGQGTGHAPPLSSPLVRGALPGTLFWVLRNGRVFHGMPSFSRLPDAQRWQIVTFLRSEVW